MKAFALTFLFFLLSMSTFPQSEAKPIRVETDLINFEVTVTDKKGNIVRGLKSEDFQIFENGVERKIDFFEPIKNNGKSRPLAVVFALDVSGSMTEQEIEKLKFVISRFIETLADYRSQFAILTFGMRVKVLLPFTNNPDKIRKAILKLEHERDGLSTHAYDAVDTAIRMLRRQIPNQKNEKLARKIVVLITDGFPVGDLVTPETVIERANTAEVTIYSIILPSYSIFSRNKRPLLTPLEASGIIEKTGGRTFYPTEQELDEIFRALSDEFTGSYVLAFYPSEESKRDGRFREVKIKIKQGNYKIRQNRLGYKFPIQ